MIATSFSLSKKTLEELEKICELYGENRSRVISRLINEKFIEEKLNEK